MSIETLLPLLMFVCIGPLLFSGYPAAFILGGTALGFGLLGAAFDLIPIRALSNFPTRVFGGVAENLVLVAIPMFIFMGTVLEKTGVATDLLKCLQVLLRRVPGALALSVVLMGTIMAATTGIVGASVIMIGLMALPTMLERGYNIPLATGTVAASGTLGILIPPSIMLVLMADLLATSAGKLFVAAVFPGLVLSALYVIYVFVISALRPSYAPAIGSEVGPQSAGAMVLYAVRSFLPTTILIVLVLGSIMFGWATPTEAAGVGAVGALVLAAASGKLTRGALSDSVVSSCMTNAMLFMLFIGATAFSYVFRLLGGDDLIVDFFEVSGLGAWGTLAVMMTIIFLLGFLFDWIEITLIVLPVFAPMMEILDFGGHVPADQIVVWFAILVAMNLQTSYLTPPFAITLFYLRAIAPPQVRIQDLYRGVVPFVILQLIGLIVVIVFPDVALWLPRRLLG
jgi:tripartite ATP-independent transporter DctM subunit